MKDTYTICKDCEWAKLSTPVATGVLQVKCLDKGVTLKKPFLPLGCNRYQQKSNRRK